MVQVVSQARTREFSKAVFGNSYRLEVVRAIASSEDGVVFARQLALELGVADSIVHPILRQLADVGLLEPLPRVKGHQMREYARTDSVLWVFCAKLIDEAVNAGPQVRSGI